MKTLIIKEKRYPAFCKNHPDKMPMFHLMDEHGKGVTLSKIISEDYYNEIMNLHVWIKIRDDETLIIHQQQ